MTGLLQFGDPLEDEKGQAQTPAPTPPANGLLDFGDNDPLAFGQPVPIKSPDERSLEDKTFEFIFGIEEQEFFRRAEEIKATGGETAWQQNKALFKHLGGSLKEIAWNTPSGFKSAALAIGSAIGNPGMVIDGGKAAFAELVDAGKESYAENGVTGLATSLVKTLGSMAYEMTIAPVIRSTTKGFVMTPEEAKLEGQLFGANLVGLGLGAASAKLLAATKLGTNGALAMKMAKAKTPEELFAILQTSADEPLKKALVEQLTKPEALRTLARSSIDGVGAGGFQGLMSGQSPEESWKNAFSFAAAGVFFGGLIEGGRYAKSRGLKTFADYYKANKALEANRAAAGRLKMDQNYTLFDYLDQGGLLDKAFALALKDNEFTLLTDVDKVTAEVLTREDAYGLISTPKLEVAGRQFEVIDGGKKLKHLDGDEVGSEVDVMYFDNRQLSDLENIVTETRLFESLDGTAYGFSQNFIENAYRIKKLDDGRYATFVIDPVRGIDVPLARMTSIVDPHTGASTFDSQDFKLSEVAPERGMHNENQSGAYGLNRVAKVKSVGDAGIEIEFASEPGAAYSPPAPIPISRVLHKRGNTYKVLLGKNLNIGDEARRMFEATGFVPNQLVHVNGKEYIYRGPEQPLSAKMVGDNTVLLDNGTKVEYNPQVTSTADESILYFNANEYKAWRQELQEHVDAGRITNWRHIVQKDLRDGMPSIFLSHTFPADAMHGITGKAPKPGMIAVRVQTPDTYVGGSVRFGTQKTPFEVLGTVKEPNLIREAAQDTYKGKVVVEEIPKTPTGVGKQKKMQVGRVKAINGELRVWEGFDKTPPELEGTVAVGEDGTPVRYFHGTSRGYDEFNPARSNAGIFTQEGEGIYLTSSTDLASSYTGDASTMTYVRPRDEGGVTYGASNVRMAKLLIKNPFDVGDWTDPKKRFDYDKDRANDIIGKAWLYASNRFTAGITKFYKELHTRYDDNGVPVGQYGKLDDELFLYDFFTERLNNPYTTDKVTGYELIQYLKGISTIPAQNLEAWMHELNMPNDIRAEIFKEIFDTTQPRSPHSVDYSWHMSKILGDQGYDSIIHQGGIYAGGGRLLHNVVIAFDQSQIKSPWIQDAVEFESVKRGETRKLNTEMIDEAHKHLPDEDKAFIESLKARDKAKHDTDITDLVELAAMANHTFEVGVGGRVYLKDLATGERVRNADGKLAMETVEDARAMLEARGLSVSVDNLMVDVDAALGYSPVNSVPRTGTDQNILTPREANFREKLVAGGILTGRWIAQPREVASALQIKYKLPMMDFWAKVSKAHIQYQNRVGNDLTWYHGLMFYAIQARTPVELAAKMNKFEIEFGDHLADIMKTIDPDDVAEGFAKAVKFSRLLKDNPPEAKKFFETEKMFEQYPELQEVAHMLEGARRDNIAALSVGKAHRYSLAKLSDAIGQSEFLTRNNFTKEEIDAVRRMEQVFGVLAAQYKIDPDILLDGYLPHLRQFDPNALHAELKYKRDKPVNEDFFADLTRTGETNPLEMIDDPFVLGEQYIRMYHRAKELNPVINEAVNTLETAWDNQKQGLSQMLNSDARKVATVRDQMKSVVEDVTSGAYGATHALDSEIMHSFTKWLNHLTGGRIKLAETHDIITAWTKMAEFNAQGFKISAGVRDLTSTVQFYTMRHGVSRTTKMLRMIPLAAKQADLFEQLGIQPSLSRTKLDVSDAAGISTAPRLNVNRMADELGQAGFKYSLQPQVYRATFAASYLESRSTALAAIKDYITHRNPEKLSKALDLHEIGTAEANTFIEKLNAGRVTEALDFYARTNAEEMVGIFGALNSPHLARHNSFGRAFMQYGVWPLWWTANMSRAMARKNAFGIGKTLAYAGVLAWATDKVAEETGFNLDSWKLLSMYRPDLNDDDEPDIPIGLPIVPQPIASYAADMGGPVVQTIANTAQIVRGSGSENEYYQNQKEQAMSEMARSLDPTNPALNVFYPKPLPMAYAFDIFKRYADGQPMHILAGRFLGITPNSEEYPRPE
jgi:hypothetical protein